MDRNNLLPKSPRELGEKSLSELLHEGTVEIDTDADFPKAIGVTNFVKNLLAFGNFRWDILINDLTDSPFLTSDSPLAVEETADPRIVNRVIPLTPKLAVRIRPTLDLSQTEIGSESFEHFRVRRLKLSHREVRKINQLIVRSAEDMVFSPVNLPRVAKFVARNRRYRVLGLNDRIPQGTGYISITRTCVREV